MIPRRCSLDCTVQIHELWYTKSATILRLKLLVYFFHVSCLNKTDNGYRQYYTVEYLVPHSTLLDTVAAHGFLEIHCKPTITI